MGHFIPSIPRVVFDNWATTVYLSTGSDPPVILFLMRCMRQVWQLGTFVVIRGFVAIEIGLLSCGLTAASGWESKFEKSLQHSKYKFYFPANFFLEVSIWKRELHFTVNPFLSRKGLASTTTIDSPALFMSVFMVTMGFRRWAFFNLRVRLVPFQKHELIGLTWFVFNGNRLASFGFFH